MKIFLTNIPAFYKINLYNELAKKIPIMVIFAGIGSGERNADFIRGNMQFDYVTLEGSTFRKACQLYKILKSKTYDELIIGGWENLISLVAPFISKKRQNSCIIESSAFESQLGGVKGMIKRLYIRRINRVYASGISQARLARSLGFISEIKLTGGCGLLNYIEQPSFEPRQEIRNFLYVGRLAEEKNLKLLIEVFNDMPELELTIVGFGSLESYLKALAKDNIKFTGAIDNKDLPMYYKKADVFILPSNAEPWGLVVEEALNNGCPVLVSDRVGCREALVTDDVGFVFRHDSIEDLKCRISDMLKIDVYNKLRKNISKMDFNSRAKKQISVYL